MTVAIALLAVLCKLVGIIFLVAAGLGLVRFSDPFQRMHAATKAGTVGAAFVVLGVILALQTLDSAIVGLFIIASLLLTVPVAGHLLGRATYISGGSLDGLAGQDALDGVIERQPQPLEERIARARGAEPGP